MQQTSLVYDTSSLYEQIGSIGQLKSAFKAVKRNKGAHGIDMQTIEMFEKQLPQELLQLHQELRNWKYKPKPVRRVEINKPDGTGKRLLGVPTIRDRVVQASIKMVLEPILDPTFSDNSYGFRPGRNQHQAILKAKEFVKMGKGYVVDIDLSKFFDRINHDRVISLLGKHIQDNRVLRLVGITLRSGVLVGDKLEVTTEGSVQGSPLSPLLSNLILNELDKEIEKRGLCFCRFADDCNVFVGSESAANRVMESITRFIEGKLKLVVNRDKSKAAPSHLVKFLGMTITEESLAISKKAMERAMLKIKLLTPRGSNLPMAKIVEKINLWYEGWVNYFDITQFPIQFAILEAHIRRRLRAMLVSQHKRRRFLYRKLVARGITHKAAKIVYEKFGPWKLSHTSAVERAWPNKWFEVDMKLFSALKLEKQNWIWKTRPKLN